MISSQEVESIHEILIDKFGGSKGPAPSIGQCLDLSSRKTQRMTDSRCEYFDSAIRRFDDSAIHVQLSNYRIAELIRLPQLICMLLMCSIFCANAQERTGPLRLGLNAGAGTQSAFPFNSPDYTYRNKYLKVQINYLLKQKTKWRFELNIEPSIYFSKHQLLNMFYIQPNRGPDYLEQRARFTKLTSFHEYALNIGIIARYPIYKNLSSYLLGSLGPMISDMATERQHKGFMFSDIIAWGTSYTIKRVMIDLRLVLRHASNAGLYYPNAGHNVSCIETGFSVIL